MEETKNNLETVAHYWNFSTFLARKKNLEANKLNNYYIQCCRELGDDVELPKQFFGFGTMCSHCGSLWNSVDHTVRISHGKYLSANIKKLMRTADKNNSNLSAFQKKLIRKCTKNQTNKLIIKCSSCQKNTKVELNRPRRLKPEKLDTSIFNNGITPKKKKKKNRDKTAGLLINTPKISDAKSVNGTERRLSITPALSSKKDKSKKFNATPATKTKKINISKLKGLINTTTTPSRKSSLHSFLTELG